MNRQIIDIALIKKAKSGDQKAFEKIFNYHYQYIYNYIYSCIKNYDDARDLTMVTFEKAFKDGINYAPSYKFSTWISRIAKNTVIDFVKYNKIRPTNVDIYEFSHLTSHIDTPEEKIIHEQNLKQMNIIINNMSIKRRRIIEMRMEGLLCREISEKINLPMGSVLGEINRAKKQLYTNLM
jgi:RNA polymerase sigma factor (sigma-70 family)